MLFGTLEQQKDILEQAAAYANANKMKLIFGAMVGSVSKGLHYVDSDYDTRFLYLREDFPDKICIPSQMKEEELVKRYYPEDKIFEWIPFWEATSFLQFLVNPSFKDDFSVGLYNIVGWTFQSPYIWDPYGLQSKIMPLVHQIFVKEYEIAYHKKVLDKYLKELEGKEVISKSYLYSLHAAATIEWSMIYNMQPPVDLQTLLYGVGRADIWEAAQKILCEAREMAKQNFDNKSKLHDSHFTIMTLYDSTLSGYVKEIESKIVLENGYRYKHNEKAESVISEIYQIIYRSVFENEKLLYNS